MHLGHAVIERKKVYNFVLPQAAQKLPAKLQMKSPIYTILLSKSDFSFALLLVTFELLEVEQSYIPLLKALMCGINAAGAQRCGCMFTFCHAYLKMGVLLHKMAIVCNLTLLAVELIVHCLALIEVFNMLVLNS